MLIGGLCSGRKHWCAEVHWAFDGTPLIGGSAGGGLAFSQASLIPGRALGRAAVSS